MIYLANLNFDANKSRSTLDCAGLAPAYGLAQLTVLRTLPDGNVQVKVLDANGKVKLIDTSKIILPGKNTFGTQL